MTIHRRKFLQQLGLGTAGLGCLSLVSGCRTAAPSAGHSPLPRSTPEAEGVASAGILAFLAAAQAKHELHSFMLVRHGRVVAEGWWQPYAPQWNHTLYSLSKSFTSTAVGLAAAEGRLTVDDPVIRYFPDDLPATVSAHLAALRIRDLLSMSVGSEPEVTLAMVRTDNWPRAFLAAPMVHPPGTVFLYNSAATYMCSAIVQRVTGETLVEYLQPRLFGPLGVTGITWETCPRGVNVGGWGLSVPTEALARFGQLYLRRGEWQGRQLLPAAWVEAATTFKIQQPLPANPSRPNARNDWLQGYGYQFWRSQHGAYRGDGAFGQFTIVLPAQDAVIAITSESKDMQGELDLVWEHLLPALHPQPLPADAAAQSQLRQTLAALALPPVSGSPASPTATQLAGRTFRLAANNLGLERATFAFAAGECVCTLADARTAYPLRAGLGKWLSGATTLPGTPPRLISGGAPPAGTSAKVAASAAWRDASTLEIRLQYFETPHHDTLTCRFENDGVSLAFMNSLAAMSASPKDARPVLRGQSS